MIQKIFFSCTIILSSFLFAQNETTKKAEYGTVDPPGSGIKKEPLQLSLDEDHIYVEVEELAEFPGGLNAFRNKFAGRFNTSKMVKMGKARTELKFVIDKTGNITDVEAEGGNKILKEEAIRTIKTIKEVWVPAKIKGQAVRYRYRLPVTFSF